MTFRPILDACEVYSKADSLKQAQRIFHGRGGRYEGCEKICVDALWPTLWISLFAEPSVGLMDWLTGTLVPWVQNHNQNQSQNHAGFERVLVQHRYRKNVLANVSVDALWGDLVDGHEVRRHDALFEARFDRQNIGFFLDIEPGRQWLEQHCAGRRVLNLFSYTCAFSVVAQQAGASAVVNVDMSKSALSTGRRNHMINQLPTDSIFFLPYNILKSWSRIAKHGPYDVVIIDPPSFQRGSFVAEKDYIKIVRRLVPMLSPHADILACLNAPELDSAFLHRVFQEAAPEYQLSDRLSALPVFKSVEPKQNLKLHHYRCGSNHSETS